MDFIIDGLPVYVADDDFLEYLAEEGYLGSITDEEIYIEWDTWAKENVIPWESKSQMRRVTKMLEDGCCS